MFGVVRAQARPVHGVPGLPLRSFDGLGMTDGCQRKFLAIGWRAGYFMPFARICLTLAMAWSFLAAPVAADSLTKDRAVVILAGLPGDMESDRAYGSEVQKLLATLNGAELKPASVTLLSGLSSPAGHQAGLPADEVGERPRDVSQARRHAQERSCACACFYRLRPWRAAGERCGFSCAGAEADGGRFSEGGGASDASTWLLFFRGSGVFAAALQGPKRTILATEAEQIFGQDPIEFPLFVDLLGRGAGSRQARATARRGDGQMVREPFARAHGGAALWIDGQPPRKLIGAGAAGEDAAAGVEPAPPPALGVTADDAWKSIPAVDAHDYPQSDAVILSRHTAHLIDDNSQVIEDEETFLQILSRAGKTLCRFRVRLHATGRGHHLRRV